MRVAGYYGLDYYVLPRIGAPRCTEFTAKRIRDALRKVFDRGTNREAQRS